MASAVAVASAGLVAVSALGATAGDVWKVQPSPNRGGSREFNGLFGVAATSLTNAWAVGYVGDSRTLIEHWNGAAWTVQRSPSPGAPSHDNFLLDSAAVSRDDAWAVGGHFDGKGYRPLIERWNGTAWKVQPSPNPAGSPSMVELSGVVATSRTNAWAVGYYDQRTLIEHWNGSVWKIQPSPDPRDSSQSNLLYGVTATSPRNAWAVGLSLNGVGKRTLIEHWNGTSWKVQPSPDPAGSGNVNELFAVAATSAKTAWAVGDEFRSVAQRTLIERWNGSTWRAQPSPNPGGTSDDHTLAGVVATSATNVWAVGDYFSRHADRTLVVHWNGSAWNVDPTPNLGGPTSDNRLSGVIATSPTNAWAVGDYSKRHAIRTLVLHCC